MTPPATCAVLGVAIDAPLRRLFDYLPPAGLSSGELRRGQRLRVPFGRRNVVGVLVELRDRSAMPAERLRTAFELLDAEPVFEGALLDLLLWAADYYHHPVGEVLSAALPTPLRSGAPMAALLTRWRLTGQYRNAVVREELPARASRLRAVLVALLAAESSGVAELEAATPHWRAAVRELERRGWVERFTSEASPPSAGAAPAVVGHLVLSPAQTDAVDAIVAALGTHRNLVLQGVTGSGKTEVYLRAITECLARGRQALLLVPEIALTPQLVRRFSERFPVPPAVLHSGLSDAERLEAWRAARTGRAGVVIGTRSAVFIPLAAPGLVIVDEEHDSSYKQQEGFRYSARDLAIARAQRESTPVVLGSATPALETLARVNRGGAQRLSLPQRAGSARPPRVALVDLRMHGAEQGLATPAMLAMHRHLDSGGQVLLYLNRRGYAPVVFCAQCGWAAVCTRCDARMTLHLRQSRLTCHHCGVQTPEPLQCPACAGSVRRVGQGTERIEETVTRLFAGAEIARIDRDVVRRRGELEDVLARVHSGAARILIGTQMLTKGHDFPGVTLVVVVNADQGLFSADFRSAERLAQTIVQVAGRAGRAATPGEVLVQTAYPEHPLLARLLQGGYEAFAAAALDERTQAGWPPSARLALFRAEAVREAAARQFLVRVRALCEEHAAPGVEVLGPAPAPMERRAGRHRAQLLLRAATHGPVQRTLRRVVTQIESLPAARRVRWSIDVDPLELF